MSTQITVGYDGTTTAADAVRWAADEAESRQARLRIVSCYEIVYMSDAMVGWPAMEAVQPLLEATELSVLGMRSSVLADHPQLEVVTEASPGRASSVLLDGLDVHNLVVVGASSHHGASAFWLGSTPRLVLRHSPCPVVVVRGRATGGAPARIVVGVDGSAMSDRAVRWAAEEADRHLVGLLVVHSWQYPYLPREVEGFSARDLTRIDAACVMDKAVELARELCGGDVDGRLVEDGPASGLLGAVKDGDLLVVGSRGRGAIVASVFGSTVNSLLEQAAVPVVVVPFEAA